MRLALTAIIIFTLLCSSVVGLQAVKVVEANWLPLEPKVPPPLPPTISITAPETRIYHEKDVMLCFNIQVSLRDDVEFRVWNENTQTMYNRTLQAPQDKAGIPFIAYTLDGIETIIRNITAPSIGLGTKDYVGSAVFDYSLNLTELSEGKHTLTVNASGRQSAANLVTMGVSPDKDPILIGKGTHYSMDAWSSSEVAFIIDAAKPTITIISPQNNTYRSTNIPLNFTIDEPTTQINYSLNGQANITITENTTLTDVPNGYHSLTLYANDTAGDMSKSDTVFFTIVTSTPSPSPSPTNSSTPSPTIPEFPAWIIPSAFLIITPVIVLSIGKKKKD